MEVPADSPLESLIAYARTHRIADDIRIDDEVIVVRHGFEAHRLTPADAIAYLARLAGNHAARPSWLTETPSSAPLMA